MGLGSALYSTAVLAYAAGLGVASRGERAAWIARVHLPVVFVSGVVAALTWAAPRTPLREASEALRAGVQGAVFLLLTVPLLVAFERRHGVLRRLRSRDRGSRGA
jgi:hypothetical protein